MNRTLAALVGLFASALLVQASDGRAPAGTPGPASVEENVRASLTPTASNPAVVLTLVNTIDTSSWSPPSPDPTGLTYRSDVGRILVADSEVDEIVSLFTGQNLFETTAAGVLVDTGSLTARTFEPTDIAWDSNARVLFVADDNLDKIFRINPQADGRFGTADDTSETAYTTSSFGSDDAEGLAYNPVDRSLWVVDGVLVRVYHLQRGADGQFNTADDVITSWDARPLGMRQPEGIEFDSTTGHLFLVDRDNYLVAEATATGALVALFDLSGSPVIGGSAITLAPASSGSGTNLYVADRGVDNDVDPNENDGKIFEFARTTVSTNVAPIVANPGGQFHVEGDAVSLQVVAFEPNGDPMTFSALDLPHGLSIDPGTGLISGTVSFDAATGVAYTVQVTASDGSLSDTETLRWQVTAGNRPPVVQNLPDQTSVEGDVVGVQVVATDPDNDPLTYSATGLPTGLAIDPGTGLISGTVAAGASAGSPYNAQVTATDPENLSDSLIVRWTVTAVPPNQPPLVENPGDQANTEGDVVGVQVVATDPDSDPLTFSANNLPAGLSIDPGTGLIAGTLALGAAAGSPYSVQVSASDGGSTDTESFLWTVLPAPNHPAAPTGLTITGDSVALRLDWANNTELDLAGYNVYRSDGLNPYTKLNGALLTLSEYADSTAAAGATSFYQVTAVNTLGNESAAAPGSARRSKIVFRAASTAKGKSATLKVARPRGVATGDVLVAAVVVRSSATITPPAGWTEVRSELNGTALRQAMFVRVVTAGEPASYTWTLGASTAVGGAILAYGGAVAPAAVSGGQANAISFSITAPDLTNPTAYSLEVGAFGTAETGGISPPAGMLEHAEVSASSGKLHESLELSDDVLDPVGPVGARVATASKAALNVGQVVILDPAP